jgi:excisionase family DNA binding protein
MDASAIRSELEVLLAAMSRLEHLLEGLAQATRSPHHETGAGDGLPRADSAPLTLTAKQTAALLQVSERQVYDMAMEGTLASIRIGRRVLFPRHRLEEFVGLRA